MEFSPNTSEGRPLPHLCNDACLDLNPSEVTTLTSIAADILLHSSQNPCPLALPNRHGGETTRSTKQYCKKNVIESTVLSITRPTQQHAHTYRVSCVYYLVFMTNDAFNLDKCLSQGKGNPKAC